MLIARTPAWPLQPLALKQTFLPINRESPQAGRARWRRGDPSDMPPLFEGLIRPEEGSDDVNRKAGFDILDLDEMEEGEDESTFPTQQSRPSSSAEVAPSVDNNLYEVCKRATAKLNIPWPAAQDAEGIVRDLYDGKQLPPAQPPAKQLLPVVPACMKEMSRIWFHSEEEDFYNNTSQMESNDYGDVKSNYNGYIYTNYGYSNATCPYYEPHMYLITCIIISIGLPLTLAAIYSLYSQVQNNNVAPIYIINLLISDIIQLCCLIGKVAKPEDWKIYVIFSYIHFFSVLPSVGFMVCVALERYLVIAWPLWYHVRRTIKISLVVCVVVWTLPL
eukprot:superscaffoldBa00009398_g24068